MCGLLETNTQATGEEESSPPYQKVGKVLVLLLFVAACVHASDGTDR